MLSREDDLHHLMRIKLIVWVRVGVIVLEEGVLSHLRYISDVGRPSGHDQLLPVAEAP